MFKKIPGNAFNFKLIKATFYFKKANVKLFSEAWPFFALSNETIERSNKIIWYFYFFWNLNRKEIATTIGKSKKYKGKLKTKTKEGVNQRNESNIWSVYSINKIIHQIVTANSLARSRIVTHSNAASFSAKTILCENTNILFSTNDWKLGKMNAKFWKNI